MRIGIVLAAVPGYSETFFRSKVKFLQETPGIEVILFADRRTGADRWDLCPVVYGNRMGSGVTGLGKLLFHFLRMLFLSPVRSFRLFLLNRKSGFNLLNNAKSLAQSSHMLPYQLDWLHFGFGTMVIGRENVATVMGSKMAMSLRGFDVSIYPLKHPGCYDLAWRKVDKVHVISDDLGILARKLGYREDRPMDKITPAIDTTRFLGIPEKPVQPSSVRMVTVARLHWKKGLELTLEALKKLNERGVDFHYTIIGEGDEYERLAFAVYQLGLTDKVEFTGKLSPEHVVERLQQSVIYIQFSLQEGFCNAVLEAQSVGLLCVVSDAEGLAENVIDGQTGWVVPRRNTDALVDRLEQIMQLGEPAKNKIIKNAQTRVLSQFGLNRQREKFLAFYDFETSRVEDRP